MFTTYDKKRFIKGLANAPLLWCGKYKDRMQFLYGVFIGIYEINFSMTEKRDFIHDVLGIDTKLDDLHAKIIELPYIEKEWKVASDPFNFLIIDACITTYQNEKSKKVRDDIIGKFIYILLIKLFSNKHNYYFKYPPKIGVVRAAYENLTLKSKIKRMGSWDAVFKSIADDEVSKFKEVKAENIAAVLAVISRKMDSMLQVYYREIVNITDGKDGIMEESATADTSEGKILKDASGDSKRERLLGLYGTDDFYQSHTAKVVDSIVLGVGDVPFSLLNKDNMLAYEKLWMKILEHSIYVIDAYLRKTGYTVTPEHFEEMLTNYVGYIRSSRVDNVSLAICRKSLTKYVKKVNPSIGKNLLAKLRTYIMVYIFLRAIEG